MTEPDGLRIIELRSENVKRIVAVRVAPGGEPGTVVIAGANGAGKTSVLDAIMFALAGKSAQKGTPHPIRDGADRAYVKLDLGHFTVERRWHGDKSELVVTAADGAHYGSPQKFLDERLGDLSFDPLAFARAPGKDQRDQLLGMVELGFDPDEVEHKRQGYFDQRTDVNRRLRDAEGELRDLPVPDPQLPDDLLSVTEMAAVIEAAVKRGRDYDDAQRMVREQTARVDELRRNLEAAEQDLLTLRMEVVGMERGPDADELEQLRSELANVEATNDAIRARQHREGLIVRRDVLAAEADGHTRGIEALDKGKADALAKAQMPIEGLGFDAEGVTYQGQPFSQASAAEQLRVSVAIGMASHPDIRIMRITDGSLLDSTNMDVIEQLAIEHGFQVWIERVDESGRVGVVIEDGTVADAEPWPPEQPDTEVLVLDRCMASKAEGNQVLRCTRPSHHDDEDHDYELLGQLTQP